MSEPKIDDCAAKRPWRILLAEDDTLLANTVDDFLSDEGFLVSLATDGQQALCRAKEQPFDVLLTDLRMPHLDGTELIRLLREIRPDLPVVIMSGNAPVDLRTRLTRQGEGPTAMVSKPMRLQELLQALQLVLGKTACQH
jgi:two-component system response regulator FlrC